jgi:hypothetical protein
MGHVSNCSTAERLSLIAAAVVKVTVHQSAVAALLSTTKYLKYTRQLHCHSIMQSLVC